MSVIAYIDNIPLFTTTQEALAWASANGLSGYHAHSLQGQVGYMGGASHQQAISREPIPTTPSSPTPNGGSMGGGAAGAAGAGGGGGGGGAGGGGY